MRARAAIWMLVVVAVCPALRAQEPALERSTESRVASAPSDASRADRHFLQLAIDRGAKEVQFSQRALERLENPKVKAFAQRLIEDHSALNRELMALNQNLLGDEGPPFKRASASVRREVEQLSKLTGVELDRRYMQIMMKDHQASIDLFAQQAERGRDPKLRELAQRALPTLQQHQKTAHEIYEGLRRGADR